MRPLGSGFILRGGPDQFHMFNGSTFHSLSPDGEYHPELSPQF